MELMKRLIREEEGQGLTEYGLLLATVVAIVVAALLVFDTSITALLEKVTDNLDAITIP